MLVSEIQSQLSRIWESLEGTNKMRACLFNLVLYTEKNERALYIQELAQKVIERFPSRVIFITIDKEAPPSTLKANVSIMTAAKGECDVVCDYIELELSSDEMAKVPFILLPHILPDLPIYLLWGEDPSQESPISREIESLATRVIFDSETASRLVPFAEAVLRRKEEGTCDVADLNWARTESWRELFSVTFHSPERLEQLSRAKTVQIAYNARKTPFCCHTQVQALYIQTWLSAQLQWPKDKVALALKGEERLDLPPGAIISYDLTTDQNEHFSFTRNPELPNQISLIFSTSERCEIPAKFIFTKSQSGLSLVNEICHAGTSSHYLRMLSYLRGVVC